MQGRVFHLSLLQQTLGMFYVASTRFTSETYAENQAYRRDTNQAVVYGSPYSIREQYTRHAWVMVLEMNITTNRLEGIGMIVNRCIFPKRDTIHQQSDYNRYLYGGPWWWSRDELRVRDADLLAWVETRLFKGKGHMKRLVGITVLTPKVLRDDAWTWEEWIERMKEWCRPIGTASDPTASDPTACPESPAQGCSESSKLNPGGPGAPSEIVDALHGLSAGSLHGGRMLVDSPGVDALARRDPE
jgi:hypothetical protein